MAELLTIGVFALLVIAITYTIGELIGTATKAWIPSVFVIAILFLIGYWTVFPKDIIEIAGLGPPLGGTIATLLIVTHMGTTMSIQELGRQWKVIVNCLIGLAGMIAFCMLIAARFVDFNYIIAGVPPLTGGIVAAMMMQQSAMELGLERAAILAICMYVCQGFAGYPLTAIMLKQECKTLLKEYRGGTVRSVAGGISGIDPDTGKPITAETQRKKLIPPMPDKYQSTAMYIAKAALVATIAQLLSNATASWGVMKINAGVIALILGVVLCQIGFLEKDLLKKAGVINFLIFVIMVYIFGGLKNATPAMLLEILGPLFFIIIVGVVGMTIFCLIFAKIAKISPYMACSTAYTALYGFPPNYVLTNEATKAMAETPEEREYLTEQLMPQMLVGGFTTVTITSVFIASIFIPLLTATA